MSISNTSCRREFACLKGKIHSSRGQRPRWKLNAEFCNELTMHISSEGGCGRRICLKGKIHGSRGQRPRWESGKEFCPVRAIQNPPFSRRHATIITHSQCAYHFFHQTAQTLVGERHPAARLGLSISNSSDAGMQFDNCGWCGGSCAYSLQSLKKACANESLGIAQKGFFEICKNTESRSVGLSLAGWLWAFCRQPIPLSCGPGIHLGPGKTPQETNVSRRTPRYSKKIRRGIRRAVSLGLRTGWTALSGRADFSTILPRALPSAKMVQPFGLPSCYRAIFRNYNGSRPQMWLPPPESFPLFHPRPS